MSIYARRFFISGAIITGFSTGAFFLLAHFLGASRYYAVWSCTLYFSITALNFFIQRNFVFSNGGSFMRFIIVNLFLAMLFFLFQSAFVVFYDGDVVGFVGVIFYLCISLCMFPISYFLNKKVFSCA